MMKIDLTIALLTLRAAEPEQLGGPYLLCVRKEINFASHTVSVLGVTYNQYFILLMCSYSASSIFEFATSSSSGEIQVDSRPSLNRANFLEEAPNKKILNGWRKMAASKRPHRGQETSTFGLYLVQLTQRPNLWKFNYLKTATSAV